MMNYDFIMNHDQDDLDHGVDVFGLEYDALDRLGVYLVDLLYRLFPGYTNADMAEVIGNSEYSNSIEGFIDKLLTSMSKIYTDKLLSQLYDRLSPEMQYDFIDTINEIFMFSNLHIVHQDDALVIVNIR